MRRVAEFLGLSLTALFLLGIGAAVFSGIVFLIAGGAGLLWPPLALIVYGLALLFALWFLLAFQSETDEDSFKGVGLAGVASVTLNLVVVFIPPIIFLSAQFLRHWSLQFGGFSPQSGDYLAWTLYALSWLLDNGLGNFGQIFGWVLSPIHPVNDTARTVVWIYNLALEFLAVAAVVKIAGSVARAWRATR